MARFLIRLIVCAALIAGGILISDSSFAGGVKQISGKVKYVDLDERSIVIGGPSKDMVMYLLEDSTLYKGQQKISLNDIMVGNIVEIQYVETDGDLFVKTLSLTF